MTADGELPARLSRAVEDDDLGAFYDALEREGRPVVTAQQVARRLDCSQAETEDLLAHLRESGSVESVDVSTDPVVWYPTEWGELATRERVILFPERREIIVDCPTQYTRAQLSQFATLDDTTGERDDGTRGFVYSIRREDIWQSPFDELGTLLASVRSVLPRRSAHLEGWIEDQWTRARQFTLWTHEDGYTVLEAASEDLMGNVARQKLDEEQLHAPISDTEAWVREGAEGEIKRVLYEAGYPVQDDRELESGDPLDFELQLQLRDYQQDWVQRFVEQQSGVFVGPPGSGKTVAGMAAMAEIGGETLILVPSRELAEQWRDELLAHTTLTEEQVGVYHGGAKEVRPVTIATYQIASMDRHRSLFDSRSWGMITYDECLTEETIIETSQGKRTFGDLDSELGFDEGWNHGVDFSVRTFGTDSSEYEWTQVNGVYKTEAPVERVETNTGRAFRASLGHTHLVFDPETADISEKTGIEEGDFLLEPLRKTTAEYDWGPIQNPEIARAELIGWFIGDGHLNQYDNVKFSFARRASEQIDILKRLCDAIDADYSVFENARGDLTLYAPKLGSKLGWQGDTGNKTNSVSVPPEAYAWPEERIGAILRGLFDAEGSVSKDKGRIELSTTSSKLATDIDLLLQKLGILSRHIQIEREADEHSDVYRVTVPTYYSKQFDEAVGFRLGHKAERIQSGVAPATALPVGNLLASIKSDLHLTNEQLSEMCGASSQVVGDVIRGQYRIGQQYLQPLAESLRRYATRPITNPESAREKYNVTYERIGDSLGTSVGASHRQMSNAKDDAFEAVIGIVEERKRRADEYASKLRQLESMRALEVDNVQRDGVETVYDFETESGTFLANGVLTHNCHHIPSPIYRLSADLQSKARLGLTATPVRGDDRETEIFTLVGPPIGTDWDKLFDAGYVAEPEVEVRLLPWADEESRNVWANAEGRERHQLAATNRRKVEEIRRLRDDHPEAKALIFVDWLKQGHDIAETLGLPFVSGETPHHERRRLFREFRDGDRRTLIVSRVGDEGIDLPSAELAIVASGLGGSRRQGAQRAGRTMRPTGSALVYVLATRGTSEENFAERQTRHLSEKGVRVRERTVADADADDE